MLKAFGCISALVVTGFLWNTNFNTAASTGKQPVIEKIKVTDTTFSRAKANYINYCGGCHGEKMDAFVDRKWKHGNSREDLFKAIKYGYENEGMPAYDTTFTDEETYELSDYILTGIENLKRYDFKNEPVKENFFPSNDIDIRLDTIVKGIGVAWGMTFLPNGDLLFTEKSGKLYRVNEKKEMQLIKGVPEVLFCTAGRADGYCIAS
jgi:aldose sugar dehydrogenase